MIKVFRLFLLFSVLPFSLEAADNELISQFGSPSQGQALQFEQEEKRLLAMTKTILHSQKDGNVQKKADALWFYDKDKNPVSIFKPIESTSREEADKLEWRAVKEPSFEAVSTSFARTIGFSDIVVPSMIVGGKDEEQLFDSPLRGTLEPVVPLVDRDHIDPELEEFGKHIAALLNQPTSYGVNLQNYFDLIDKDTKETIEQKTAKKARTYNVKGAPQLSYQDYKFFNKHVDLASVQKIALLDMLLVHRDMKPDNIMLHLVGNTIKFVVIDWEYALQTHTQVPAFKRGIYFKPFYLDFIDIDKPLDQEVKEKFCQINLEEIKRYMQSRGFDCEYKKIESRFQWMQEAISQNELLSINELYAKFLDQEPEIKLVHETNMKKLAEADHNYNGLRLFLNKKQFMTLNPSRSQRPEQWPFDKLFAREYQLLSQTPVVNERSRSRYSNHDPAKVEQLLNKIFSNEYQLLQQTPVIHEEPEARHLKDQFKEENDQDVLLETFHQKRPYDQKEENKRHKKRVKFED